MKFLCVPCDEPMRLLGTEGPEEGSLTVIFGCPRCPNKVAMLTNPWETQLVRALDVKVGGPGSLPAPLRLVRSTLVRRREGLAMDGNVMAGAAIGITWAPEAQERLERIPSFAGTMAREGIERFAREHGYQQITEQVMDEARQAMGM